MPSDFCVFKTSASSHLEDLARSLISICLQYNIGLPEVTVEPSWQRVEVTYTAVFTAIANGVGVESFAYIWFHNDTVISGHKNPVLILNDVTESSNGKYQVNVTNLCGDTSKSNYAELIVYGKCSYCNPKY